MIKTYYLLTKPGIIFGNLVTTVAGFALASKGHFNWLLFLHVLVGLGCAIGSACVLNNYLDRHLDSKMERTKNRGLAKGTVTVPAALLFSFLLALAGFSLLAYFTNWLTVAIVALAFFIYVVPYSLLKPKTDYGTIIGSVSGAIPPVVGYTAVTNQIDTGAVLLFLFLVLWQMPHFFSIAFWRLQDYAAAEIPVLPLTKGKSRTINHMLAYIAAFILSGIALTVEGYTSGMFLLMSVVLGVVWLGLCLRGFKADEQKWAKQMFQYSLVVIMILCTIITWDNFSSQWV